MIGCNFKKKSVLILDCFWIEMWGRVPLASLGRSNFDVVLEKVGIELRPDL